MAEPNWYSCELKKTVEACDHGFLAVSLVNFVLPVTRVRVGHRKDGCLT